MSGHDNERLGDLADRLDAISEELAGAAIDVLREAVRRREPGRPAAEKTLTQARRAVEKAAHLLRGIGQSGSGESGSGELDDVADAD